jgi:DNA-binding transcriptional MerR regulator
MTQTFSGTQAADVVGITYRRLDYWARTDLVRPSALDATGSGSRRRYTYRDLLELRIIKQLLDAGIRLESIRDVFAYLRDHIETDISAAHLVINGSSVVLCNGDELIDVLRHGQGVLNILPMDSVRDEVDKQIVLLYPVDESNVAEISRAV